MERYKNQETRYKQAPNNKFQIFGIFKLFGSCFLYLGD